ncbi:GIY-YIG nuclease family protein [Hymenobacter elongatus]|uniref:GIY-YIG nuclease family protein n=1 Tax=Hymenobacter elongatus TaxID=877208 RepID=A0A4Z0PT32_9BACT|nr:GIY-YIG nuclease family protein [Hymenobacter elongatus]TGE20023.1 GIY-YIG nuclease family protein [Hymenobacter elongatus]
MRAHKYFVYIVTNPTKTVLYTGITNDLETRLHQHCENRDLPTTFAGRYHCYLLLYFEHYREVEQAIAREKEIKGWTRLKKEALVRQFNPEWQIIDPQLWQPAEE